MPESCLRSCCLAGSTGRESSMRDVRAGHSARGRSPAWGRHTQQTPPLPLHLQLSRVPAVSVEHGNPSVGAGVMRLENLEGLGPNMNRPRMPPHTVRPQLPFL